MPDAAPTRETLLRGEYGPYRANNDLLYYHLDVRVDPEKQTISGKNTIRFRMLKDDNKIQLDLQKASTSRRSSWANCRLNSKGNSGRSLSLFRRRSRPGNSARSTSTTRASRPPAERFGGFAFRKDPAGRPWIYTSCEMQGASVWWPNKDQWRDEVESMDLSVTIPGDLVDASNGRLIAKKDLGDGTTRGTGTSATRSTITVSR